MDEFNNRMEAQRNVLNVVNSCKQWREELCGLSSHAIERWARINEIEPDGRLMTILTETSKKLFFLAAKSQEQISSDYQKLSRDVEELIARLNRTLG